MLRYKHISVRRDAVDDGMTYLIAVLAVGADASRYALRSNTVPVSNSKDVVVALINEIFAVQRWYFLQLNIVERRAAEERAFNEWVAADPKRVEKYGTAVETINNAIKERAEYAYVYRYITETLSAIELIKAPARAKRGGMDGFFKDYSASTDRKLAKRMIGGSIDAFVDNLYDNSVYVSKEKYDAAVAAGADLGNDPVEDLRAQLHIVSNRIMPKLLASSAKIDKAKKAYVAGTLEMMGDNASYPDANSTMRLTYSKVLPYSPKDAVIYDYITTLDGVMEKEDPNNWEFVVPARLKELYKFQDYGQYAMADGRMPVAFLSNNDITGGNSGSPIMNANGELIGLAFDGNWESMSSDVMFEPELQRCINVDIRYVLFIVEKFGGAKWLVDEMEIVK